MLPEKLDLMLAAKAMGLASGFSSSARRVFFLLLEHYNRTTGRCDPSYATLAKLLGIAERTVARAIALLIKQRFLIVVRHGGQNHCNSYQPNWPLFRKIEADWKSRRAEHSARFDRARLSSFNRQICPEEQDKSVQQTFPTNSIPLTSDTRQSADTVKAVPTKGAWQGSKISKMSVSSSEAARDSAERRWATELQKRYIQSRELYAVIIEAIDEELKSAVTDAEQKKPGSGVSFVLRELQKRGVRVV